MEYLNAAIGEKKYNVISVFQEKYATHEWQMTNSNVISYESKLQG